MKKIQIGMDKFKIISAILIIAVHTYPFGSINENFDFVFTHVLCRIAVPFFLMVTGYFVLPKAIENKKTLINYTIKILKIYAICILLYLPVGIYAGKFKKIGILGILKAIFIDGTFYHLWYFPALVLGIWLTYLIIKKINGKKALFVLIPLFIIGLFGDSYYGISEKFAIIKMIYSMIFKVFEYTRNGNFFVPIFLYFGYMLKNDPLKLNQKQNYILLLGSIILMIVEGVILHHFELQRHDSMYIMLLPTMLLLFNIIMQNKNENNKMLRNISTVIYIMHPLFIIVVRGVAKVVHLQSLMIDNSLVHYLLVVISTVLFSVIYEKVKEKATKGVEVLKANKD